MPAAENQGMERLFIRGIRRKREAGDFGQNRTGPRQGQMAGGEEWMKDVLGNPHPRRFHRPARSSVIVGVPVGRVLWREFRFLLENLLPDIERDKKEDEPHGDEQPMGKDETGLASGEAINAHVLDAV